MKMKFRYLVNSAMLWTALALGSCADFLNREPYSEPVDESYWNSEEDVEAAVAGGYGLLRAALANHSAYYAYGDIAGTNVFSKFEYEDEDWNQMNQFKLDYAIAASETYRPLKQLRNYQLFYRVVNQCNRALKKVGQMSDEVFDDGEKEKYIGELYFLRGYTYFYMYRIWGELPIVTTSPDNVINADYVARSPLADVAALIYSDLEEAEIVGNRIMQLHSREHYGYSDCAILYRTNAQSRVFEETLRKKNIPYRIYGGLSFYQRKEIKDIIAYFRLAVNPNDEEAFKRVLNYPARGIGDTTLNKLVDAANRHKVSLWTVVNEPLAYGVDINKGTHTKLQGFRALIAGFVEAVPQKNAFELGKEIVFQSGIGREITQDRSPENLSRQENVEELYS